MTVQQTSTAESLLEIYAPIFAFISALEAKNDYGDPEDLARQTAKLLENIRERCQDLNKNKDWVADAQYAVVAFVDESIHRSKWHGQAAWIRRPLVAMLNLEGVPGVTFFEKLESWRRARQRSHEINELLEVYYVCLQLGFQGQFHQQQDRLARIKHELMTDLTEGGTSPDALSPHAYRLPEDEVPPTRDTFPWTWFLSIVAGALLLLFLILKLLSVGEINGLVEELKR